MARPFGSRNSVEAKMFGMRFVLKYLHDPRSDMPEWVHKLSRMIAFDEIDHRKSLPGVPNCNLKKWAKNKESL